MCECEQENVSSSSPFTRLFSVTLLSGFHLLWEELTESLTESHSFNCHKQLQVKSEAELRSVQNTLNLLNQSLSPTFSRKLWNMKILNSWWICYSSSSSGSGSRGSWVISSGTTQSESTHWFTLFYTWNPRQWWNQNWIQIQNYANTTSGMQSGRHHKTNVVLPFDVKMQLLEKKLKPKELCVVDEKPWVMDGVCGRRLRLRHERKETHNRGFVSDESLQEPSSWCPVTGSELLSVHCLMCSGGLTAAGRDGWREEALFSFHYTHNFKYLPLEAQLAAGFPPGPCSWLGRCRSHHWVTVFSIIFHLS